MRIGIIGGSGFYDLGEREVSVSTRFGKVNVAIQEKNNVEIYFISRHQKGHKVPPHKINYHANILAFHEAGVEAILATNAVGSLYSELYPGTIVIPHDLIDMTKTRSYTFFDGEFEIVIGKEVKKGVVHTDASQVLNPLVRECLIDSAKNVSRSVVPRGILVAMEGPRFETPSEIIALRRLGATIVGMTSSPEAFLARELEIPYATVAFVTNFAAGMQSEITHEEVVELFNEIRPKIKKLIIDAALAYSSRKRDQ